MAIFVEKFKRKDMADSYNTITDAAEAIFKEKMSKFLAFAYHVESADEAREYVRQVAKKYYDARHVCWAYMIGPDRLESMSNDNGEPSGTAGKPILGQINSFNLTNIVIIVVRYFGGIKLGTSGLIAAYREAAREAIQAANIIELHDMASLSFTFPYQSMNDVMKIVKQGEVQVVSQTFDNTCSIELSVRRDYLERLTARFLDIDGVTLAE